MDKKKIKPIALVAMTMIAMVVAGMATSVAVYAPNKDVVYCSFFTYIEDVPASICMPFSILIGAAAFGAALLYLVKKTVFWLKSLSVCALACATLSVLPLVLRTEVYMIPNMWVPILMLVVSMMAFYMTKRPQEEEKKPKGKRLE